MLLKKLYRISYGYKKFEIFPSFCWNNKFKIFTVSGRRIQQFNFYLISFHMNIVCHYYTLFFLDHVNFKCTCINVY